MNQRLLKATDSLREVVGYYFIALFVGAVVFSISEGVDFGDSLYWAMITASTVGYGDFSPKTWIGKADAVLLSSFSVFVLVPLIVVRFIDYVTDKKDHFSHEEQEEMKILLRQVHEDLNRPL